MGSHRLVGAGWTYPLAAQELAELSLDSTDGWQGGADTSGRENLS